MSLFQRASSALWPVQAPAGDDSYLARTRGGIDERGFKRSENPRSIYPSQPPKLAFVRGAIALVLLYAVFALPASTAGLSAPWWLALPLAWAAAVLLLAVCPRPRLFLLLRALLVLVAAALLLIKAADIATFAARGQPFNPVVHTQLPKIGWNLFQDAVGHNMAVLYFLLVAFAFLAVLVLLAWALDGLRGWTGIPRLALASLGAILLIAGLVMTFAVPTGLRILEPGNTRLVYNHVDDAVTAYQDLQAFDRMLAKTHGQAPTSPNFALLSGKDVLLVFVESYGQVALRRPLYADVIEPRLQQFQQKIQDAGFNARSAWLTAPTLGGGSWLAHGTLLSGLWVNNQPRYDKMIGSDRPALNRLFHRAGWRTVAVMPQITKAWPESEYYDYDQIYDSGNMGYQGDAFNWITMPDQYTLHVLNQKELAKKQPRPVMIETALISSHAPWTQVPELVDWDKIGDGKIFNQFAHAGDPPKTVWKDPARVRAQYAQALDYSLTALQSFIAQRADKNLVVIMVGDHQPAPIVAGDQSSHNVPIHVLSADPAVLQAIKSWSFSDGMLPGANAPTWSMAAVYDHMLDSLNIDTRQVLPLVNTYRVPAPEAESAKNQAADAGAANKPPQGQPKSGGATTQKPPASARCEDVCAHLTIQNFPAEFTIESGFPRALVRAQLD